MTHEMLFNNLAGRREHQGETETETETDTEMRDSTFYICAYIINISEF